MKQVLLAVLCVGLFGCRPVYDINHEEIGYNKDEAKYKWGKWGEPRLISIANDSLAVLAIYKAYFKEWLVCGLGDCNVFSETADRHIGLFLVNYREKQKPVWGDTLEYNLTIVKDYFRDFSVLAFDMENNKFSFWKIGAKPLFVDYTDHSGIKNREYINYNARPFENGNILLFSTARKLLLLEPESKQLKPFGFSEEYEWLSKCSNSLKEDYYCYPIDDYYYNYQNECVNISYIGGELSCIKGNKTTNNFELTVNNVVRDTSSIKSSIVGWYGSYVMDAKNKIHKIDTLYFKFDSTYISAWITDEDSENGEHSVHYTTQDLLGVYD